MKQIKKKVKKMSGDLKFKIIDADNRAIKLIEINKL